MSGDVPTGCPVPVLHADPRFASASLLLTAPTYTGPTILPVCIFTARSAALPALNSGWTDYEQQRLHLLHKHGIDLEESSGFGDGTRTKRLDRKEVERLMGGGDGQSGVFTWREKHRRKVRLTSPPRA